MPVGLDGVGLALRCAPLLRAQRIQNEAYLLRWVLLRALFLFFLSICLASCFVDSVVYPLRRQGSLVSSIKLSIIFSRHLLY